MKRTDVGGSFEVGFTRNIAVQADLGFTEFGAADLSLMTLGLHGIHHASEATSVGQFLVHHRVADAGNRNVLGVEVGYEGPSFDMQAYYGAVASSRGDGMIAGVSGAHGISDIFSVGLAVDRPDAAGTMH